MYFKAFNVLPADVKNKIDIRQKAFGCNKMRHGFHNAVISVEGMFYKFFAVACNGSGKYFAVGVFFVKSGQVIAHGDNGVAFVALVKRIKQFAVRCNYGNFYGCAAAVDAEIGFPGGCNIAALNIVAVMARNKGVIFFNIFKQRRQMLKLAVGIRSVHFFRQRGKVYGVFGTKSAAHCHII